jgi:hypothetical protein
LTDTCTTRARIQPIEAVAAGTMCLLWLSEGWLVDRGFM